MDHSRGPSLVSFYDMRGECGGGGGAIIMQILKGYHFTDFHLETGYPLAPFGEPEVNNSLL